MPLSPSILVRTIIAQLYKTSGMFRVQLQKHVQKRESVILMYHRVLSPSQTDEYIEPGMFVTPSTFEMHLNLLTKYFDIVSLQHLVESPKTESSRPRCAITFDDGWHDFYTNAYPLIHNKKIPVTVFLPTSYIGTNKRFWTDRLATILKNPHSSSARLSADNRVSQIRQLSGSLFSRIDAALKLLKPYAQEEINKVLDELELHFNNSNTNKKRVFLDWHECRTLRNSGHVAFGSHTTQHIILSSENEQRCREELDISKKKLLVEEVVDQSFIAFCYPNGGFTRDNARIVEETGYHCAVTTKTGWVGDTSNRFAFNRVGIHQDITRSGALLLAQIR